MENDSRREVFRIVDTVAVGQRVNIAERLFRDAFPTHPLFEERSPVDQFLEKMVGANYGAWTCHFDAIRGCYIIAHNEPGEKIIRRDFDRRHIPLPA